MLKRNERDWEDHLWSDVRNLGYRGILNGIPWSFIIKRPCDDAVRDIGAINPEHQVT